MYIKWGRFHTGASQERWCPFTQ